MARRNNFADLELLQCWYRRPAGKLAEIAADARWPLRREESLNIARSVYSDQPGGSPLRSAPGLFTLLDVERRYALLPWLAAG